MKSDEKIIENWFLNVHNTVMKMLSTRSAQLYETLRIPSQYNKRTEQCGRREPKKRNSLSFSRRSDSNPYTYPIYTSKFICLAKLHHEIWQWEDFCYEDTKVKGKIVCLRNSKLYGRDSSAVWWTDSNAGCRFECGGTLCNHKTRTAPNRFV